MLDQSLEVALVQNGLIPVPFCLRPGVGLTLAGAGGLQSDAGAAQAQGQHRLRKVQVRPPGHAADEVAHPLGVGSLHRLGQTALQRQTAGVRLPAAPGQLVRAVPGEAAGGGAVHGASLPAVFFYCNLNREDCQRR